MKGRSGWTGESRRHSLARKGIRTVDRRMYARGYEWMASVPSSVMYKNPNTNQKEMVLDDETIFRGVTIKDIILFLESDRAFHDNTTKEQMKKSLKEFLKLNQDVFEQDFEFYVDHVLPEFLKTEFMLHGKYKKGMIGSGIYEELPKSERIKLAILELRLDPKLSHLKRREGKELVMHSYKIDKDEFEDHAMMIDDNLEKYWNLYYKVKEEFRREKEGGK